MKLLISIQPQQRLLLIIVVILIVDERFATAYTTSSNNHLNRRPCNQQQQQQQQQRQLRIFVTDIPSRSDCWNIRTSHTTSRTNVLSSLILLSSSNNDSLDGTDRTSDNNKPNLDKTTPTFTTSSGTGTNLDSDSLQSTTLSGGNDNNENNGVVPVVALTGTVNERLMAELENARLKEQFGARSGSSPRAKKQRRFGLDQYRTNRKTEDERLAAIEEAKNLNGINPVVAIGGAAIAFGCAALLWILTDFLAGYFAVRPVENISDIYFIQRVTAVFRNVVVGLVSLASGFFGVTGFGIFLLSIRVAYGVITGELDPTPIEAPSNNDKKELPNVWDLMLNKKPGRTRR